MFSYPPDTWKYVDNVCGVEALRKYMVFDSEIVGCYWQQDSGGWFVNIKQIATDGSSNVIDARCLQFLNGSGILSNFKWPNIGCMEKFKENIKWQPAARPASC